MQLFRPLDGSPPIVGVVGLLQVDVLASRIKTEYGVPVGFESAQWDVLRWVQGEDRAAIERFQKQHRSDCAEDHDGALVALFSSDWRRRRAEEEFPTLKFHAVREQHALAG